MSCLPGSVLPGLKTTHSKSTAQMNRTPAQAPVSEGDALQPFVFINLPFVRLSDKGSAVSRQWWDHILPTNVNTQVFLQLVHLCSSQPAHARCAEGGGASGQPTCPKLPSGPRAIADPPAEWAQGTKCSPHKTKDFFKNS